MLSPTAVLAYEAVISCSTVTSKSILITEFFKDMVKKDIFGLKQVLIKDLSPPITPLNSIQEDLEFKLDYLKSDTCWMI